MYTNFNSKKYMFLLILICFIFTIFVIKAFDYLPPKEIQVVEDSKVNQPEKEIKTNITSESNSNTEIKSEIKTEKSALNPKSGILYKNPNSLHDETKFDEIEPPAGAMNEELPIVSDIEKNINNSGNTSLSNDELALRSIIKARKLTSNSYYSEALEEYQKVIELTGDKELLAESYDGISELYAKNKRYSTALSFAGKAYKASPSLTREFLIAKIYYMAGQTEIAITRINTMLKRGLN